MSVDTRTVTPAYFETLGIRRLAGRGFDERDDGNAPRVVIVDERIARTVWPGQSAIGKRMREPEWRGGEWAEVIGVVAHVRTAGLEIDPFPQVYWSHRQWVQDRMVLAVRTDLQPPSVVAPVLAAVRSVDPQQSVYDVRTMTQVIEQSQARRQLTTVLMVGFGGVSLLLAAVGIYGVVAFGVMQRTREFGIRGALGATRRQLIRLAVWQETTTTALVGAAIGLGVAFATAGALRSLVYEVGPRDTWSMIGASALFAIVAAVASYIPARRAAMVDPAITMRAE